jgi:hypothetical protein
MSKNFPGRILATLLLYYAFLAPAMAEKTDVVVLINGNAVTGEVKSLEFGVLRYSTDSMGTVSIDWEDIVSVRSQEHHQVELTDGTRYFGELSPTADPHVVRIVTDTDEYVFSATQIVRIVPIEAGASFVERLEGSFSFGIQTQKSSDITTSNLAADVSFRALTYLVGLRVNSALTTQETEPTTARQSASINYQRFRDNRWFTDWSTGIERNDELGIDQRLSVGGALGRYLIQNNRDLLSLSGGIQGAFTDYTSDADSTQDAEGRVELRYQHRNISPETSFRITATYYPLLEDFSQYRAESDMSLRREMWEDFFLEFSLGFSYLSDPQEGAANSDYTATTSFGYSW